MRRSIFILILGLFGWLGPLAAQPMFGIRGGINNSWQSGKGLEETVIDPVQGNSERKQAALTRPDMGVFMLLPLIRNFVAFQFGVDYYGAGTRETATFQTIAGTSTIKSTMRLNYVSLPILLRLAYAREDMRVYALGGTFTSYAMSGKVETESAAGKEKDDVEFSDEGYQRLDYGLMAGLGVMIRVGPVWLGPEAQYRKGLVNLNRNSDPMLGATKDQLQPMTNTLSGGLTLHIPLGKEKY